jgi:hypothetical protein
MKRSGPGRHLGIGFLVVLLASLSIGAGGRGGKGARSGKGARGGGVGRMAAPDDHETGNSGCGSGHRARAGRGAPVRPRVHSGYSSPPFSSPGYLESPPPSYVGKRIVLTEVKRSMVISGESELPLGLDGSGLSRPHRDERVERLAHLDTSTTRERPVTQVRLLALIPNSLSGFHQVFQRSMSKQDGRVLERLRSRSVDVAAETWVDSDLFGHDQLSAKLESYDASETVMIMAHSKRNGRNLRLPDGSEIEAVAVHRLCHRLGKQCIIVTCNGQDLDIRGHITITEAYGLWKAAHRVVEKRRVTTMGELSGTMQKARRRSRHHQHVAIIGVAAGAGIVYWIHAKRECREGDRSDDEPCASTRRVEAAGAVRLSPAPALPPPLPRLPPSPPPLPKP